MNELKVSVMTGEEIMAVKERELLLSTKQNRLAQLSQDLMQAYVGEFVPNLDARKAEFVTIHNELRVLAGKEPREIITRI